MFGLLNINKPSGITSRDVVNRIQRLARPAKVGHAGTLDPLATGVLVVCLGPATRLVPYIHRMKKHYLGTFVLGSSSNTDDIDGQVEHDPDPRIPTRDEIDHLIPTFKGRILQRPPAYSALKVKGRRAYALAREGAAVELEKRSVHVFQLAIKRYQYPELTLEIVCGSGTYVRALGRDIAQALKTSAVMSDLVRVGVGPFFVDDSVSFEQLTKEAWQKFTLPPSWATQALKRLDLTDQQTLRVARGMPVRSELLDHVNAGEIAAFHGGDLVAILSQRGKDLIPIRNFSAAFTKVRDPKNS